MTRAASTSPAVALATSIGFRAAAEFVRIMIGSSWFLSQVVASWRPGKERCQADSGPTTGKSMGVSTATLK